MVPGACPGGILQPGPTSSWEGMWSTCRQGIRCMRMKRLAESSKTSLNSSREVYVMRSGANISGCCLCIDFCFSFSK